MCSVAPYAYIKLAETFRNMSGIFECLDFVYESNFK